MIRRKLRVECVRGIPRGRRGQTRVNLLGLTPRQVEILRLLAENPSTRKLPPGWAFSPKTVDHHVVAVLAMLDVPTRKEAAAHAVTAALLAKHRESAAPR